VLGSDEVGEIERHGANYHQNLTDRQRFREDAQAMAGDAFTLPQTSREAARRFGDLTAFETADGWNLSYSDLDRISDEVGAWLARRGVGAGDVVVLSLPSTVEYAVAYIAAAKVGAVTAGLNPSLAAPERARLVELADARLVLTTDELADGVPEGFDVQRVKLATGVDDLLRDLRVVGESPADLPDNPERPVVIVFTSGTTGIPKGALFTDRILQAITEMDVDNRWGGGGHQLATTQFAHVGFATKFPWWLRLGSTTHLLHKWRAADVLRLIDKYRMPVVNGVAPQIALMLHVPEFDTYDFSCVQAIVAGAAPSPPGMVREARERFGAPYSIRYSSTESGGLGTLTALDAPDEEALYTVGRPRPGIELELRDEDDNLVPAGETGEVCFRSPAMMAGYWRDPDATAAALRGGWLHTGDLGMIDERGCLRLVGRRKEMFIRGGYNVFPLEVESVLSAHPDVREVAIAPRPDSVMGEIGVAVVVPRDPASPPTLEDLRQYGATRLAAWKLPEAIRLTDSLPLTPMQKLDRKALAAVESASASTS
jgi:acyl-CoA synthetase (AMP-forming)/AMP-acid ligase II